MILATPACHDETSVCSESNVCLGRAHRDACEWKFRSGCVWTICLRVCVSVSLYVCVCVPLWTVCLRVCVKNELSVTAVCARHLYIAQSLKSKPDKAKKKHTDTGQHGHTQMQTASAPVNMFFLFFLIQPDLVKSIELGFFVLNWVLKKKQAYACRHVTTWQTYIAQLQIKHAKSKTREGSFHVGFLHPHTQTTWKTVTEKMQFAALEADWLS